MAIIKLTQDFTAIVDDEDFERINQFKWFASLDSRGTKWYAKRHARRSESDRWIASKIRLHHFVLDIPPHTLPEGCVVDHVNHNGLDCRKSNLEIVTQRENMMRSDRWKRKSTLLPDF